MQTLYIKANDAGQRLDKFLMKTLKTLPMSLMYRQIRTKKIKVNRKRTVQNYILQEGDTVELFISDEFFEKTSSQNILKNLTPQISVIYEDEHIILVDKKPGMTVHPDNENGTNTLIDHIKAYLYRKGEYDPENENSFAPSLCNRIDRNTGGIVIAAKTAAALRILNQKIKDREITKLYLCAVHGCPQKKSGILRGFILKNQAENTVKVYSSPVKNAKTAETKYRVIASSNGLSLIEAELLTGRTHQIRAQFADIGCPLLGDGKYGINRDDVKKGYRFQALYSYKLIFDFTTDAGCLNYLKNKEFTVSSENICFLREFPAGG